MPALIAGAMAYPITLNEMRKHFREHHVPRRAALHDAAVTAGFFLDLVLALPRIFAAG